MSMRIDMIPVIDYEEIQNELEIEITDFDFYNQNDHSDGYFWFSTDEDAIIDLENAIEDEIAAEKQYGWARDEKYIQRINNDIKLVKLLQSLGYNDGVLIYVWF